MQDDSSLLDTTKGGLGLKAVLHRRVTHDDFGTVCSWVNERIELRLVGSEDSSVLTPAILRRWVSAAELSVIFEISGVPIAFGTASTNEWQLPADFIEVGHFVVAPNMRRRYHGSTFLRIFTRLLIHGFGYRGVIARVVPTNLPSLSVMKYLRWNEISNARPWTSGASFRWFAAPEGETE
jgi:hypothetical protein